jgi:cell fate (sporulation/competence/biofilm development) regulator YlbF (YheA/YmcA/DUF963 family)
MMQRFLAGFIVLLLSFSFTAQALTNTNSLSPSPTNTSANGSFAHELPVWVSDTIAALSLLVSLANLALVVWFFCRANQDRKTERRADRDERQVRIRLEVTNFWLQELILKPSNELSHNFFNQYEHELTELPKRIQSKLDNMSEARHIATEALEKFKTQFHQINRRIVEPLIFLSDEFKSLQSIMNEIEDLVTNAFDTVRLNENAQVKNCSPDIKFRELRQRFFLTVHSVHRKLMGFD